MPLLQVQLLVLFIISTAVSSSLPVARWKYPNTQIESCLKKIDLTVPFLKFSLNADLVPVASWALRLWRQVTALTMIITIDIHIATNIDNAVDLNIGNTVNVDNDIYIVIDIDKIIIQNITNDPN